MSTHWTAPSHVLVIDDEGSFVLTRNVAAVIQSSTGSQIKGPTGEVIAVSTLSAEELRTKLLSLYEEELI